MALPTEVFAVQDWIFRERDEGKNLNSIQAFHPRDGKLALNLKESFNDENLLGVSEALSQGFERWKLTHVW